MIRHWAFFHTTVFILIAAHASINASPLTPTKQGVTGIFFWGGKVVFPDFFPILVDPKQISVVLKTEKQKKKKKKKKKKVISSFFNFSSFHFQFSFFSAPFSLFPCLSFPGTSAEISRSEVLGGTLSPICYAIATKGLCPWQGGATPQSPSSICPS